MNQPNPTGAKASASDAALLALRAREAELTQAINDAPGWGAAVAAMGEELREVQSKIRWREKDITAAYSAALASPPPVVVPENVRRLSEAEYSQDFRLMLARIIHRHGKGLDLAKTIEDARGLLARKGRMSPFRDEAATPSGRADTPPASGGPFRVGHRVPRHVYEDDTPLFTASSPEEAARLVTILNKGSTLCPSSLPSNPAP